MGADIVIAVDLNHGIVGAKNFKFGRRALLAAAPSQPTPRLGGGKYGEAAARIREELRSAAEALPSVRAWFAGDSLPNIFEVLLAAINIMETRITETRLAVDRPDVLVRPATGGMSLMDFNHAAEAITAGYNAMREALNHLELLRHRSSV
jgi:NTE family protein